MNGFLDGFAVTEEDLAEVAREAEARKESRERDGRVCVCGHPVARHRTTLGIMRCATGRMRCPCALATPVLEVSDTRGFLARTEGTGARHALMKGLVFSQAGAEKAGTEFRTEWLVEIECQRCPTVGRATQGGVVPVAVTASGFVSEEPEAANALLCERCVQELARRVMS